MGVSFYQLPCAFMGNAAWRIVSRTLSVFTVILAMSADPAWALDRLDPADVVDGSQEGLSISENNSIPSTAMADKCLPLLQSIRQTSSVSAMDRNQRAAGQAAALGLVLGFRFALSPVPKAKSATTRVGLWQPSFGNAGDQHAMAIAEYRSCQKDQALRSSLHALDGFRWER